MPVLLAIARATAASWIILGTLALSRPSKPSQPARAAVCGTVNNPCPGIRVTANTFAPVTRTAESGPYTYTITVQNMMPFSASARVTCTSTTQLPCTAPTPNSFTIGSGATQVITVGYSTIGLGRFTEQIRIENLDFDGADGKIYERYNYFNSGLVTTTGIPIATHINPLDSADFSGYDTLRASFYHSSGVVSTSFKILIDGKDSTARATVTSTGLSLGGLGATTGYHQFGTYACAVNGRCDSLFTTFNQTIDISGSVLDDSLGIGEGAGLEGLLPGALPLPVDSLKGCPVHFDDPEIRLVDPYSYVTQPANPAADLPAGYIFRASVLWGGTTLLISTSTHDYKATDYTDCTNSDPGTDTSHHVAYRYTYLSPTQYDWSYWRNASITDPLWDHYPYNDYTPSGGGVSPHLALQGGGGAGSEQGGGGQGGNPGPGPFTFTAGAINPSTYKIWINGTLVVTNGNPVGGTGVVKLDADIGAAHFTLPMTSSLLHHYDVNSPSSDSGGWNEIIASVADSTNHRSYVRSRFVVAINEAASPLTLAPLRDFSHLDQGDCAAFGAFQCAGVELTQTVPGFVTRDKNRSLHLVYRSATQRQVTPLPVDVQIQRAQLAPDSIWASPSVGGVTSGETYRYYGSKRPASVSEPDTLWDNAALEHRVLAVIDSAPAGNVAIRTVTARVLSYFSDNTTRTDTVSQDVVHVSLSDTTMTRFGPGWALAEQSRLIFGQSFNGAAAAVWLSGDGSYSVYRQVGGVWQPPAGETAHLVDLGTSYVAGAKYVLYLGNGASIGFSPNGWQAWTADLVGNRTMYGYGGGSDSTRLLTITDPSSIRWEFTYGSAGTVVAIAMRSGSLVRTMTTLGYDPSGRLAIIAIPRTGPLTDTAKIGYLAGAPGAFVDSLTDPRGNLSQFGYDANYFLPIFATRPPDHSGAGQADYRDPLRRALPRAIRGRGTYPAERLVFFNWYKGTSVDFAREPTDFQVDNFGGPTYVNRIAPPAIMTQNFQVIDYGGDFVRRIARDSAGRVTRIVESADRPDMADSVIYHRDGLGRVDTLIRNTLQWPQNGVSLDTTTYVYDSVTVDPTGAPGKAWCSRLKSMRDVLGSITTVIYGTSSAGSDRCLPQKTIGIASDTTIFAYGTLSAGQVWGVRPVSVRDPNGIVDSMQYDGATWNSTVSIRKADTATSRAYYNPFGWPDSTMDAVGIRADIRYDSSGRVIRARTGPSGGSTTPTVASFFGQGGLLDSTEVYNSDGVDATPNGTIQTTRNYFDKLGRVDSTLTPGTAGTRRNHHFLRDRFGVPLWEYGGNGTYVNRLTDWQGRVTTEALSQVYPTFSIDGQPFADPVTDSVYLSYGVRIGPSLSGGQGYWLDYDNKGRVIRETGRQVATPDSTFYTRTRVYSRANALLLETTTFTAGLTVTRMFEYNRRGQRTLMKDTLIVAAGKGSWATGAEQRGAMRYYYDATTARLDSIVDTSGTGRIGRVSWQYDRGGRDTLQAVLLQGSDAALTTITRYDPAGRRSYLSTAKSSGANAGTWYQLGSTSYSRVDELLGLATLEPSALAAPSPLSRSYTMTYATDGTRRLLQSQKSGTGTGATYSWSYDAFGNRLTENHSISTDASCNGLVAESSTFAADNALTRTAGACSRINHYYNDRAGNRLFQLDSAQTGGVSYGPQQIMSYTALNQLYFAMSPTPVTGVFDYNWHLYDIGGTRIETTINAGQSYIPGSLPSDTVGNRSFFIYDGAEALLTVVKSATTWWPYQRYVSVGADGAVFGRFSQTTGATAQNLALVADYQGSTVAAIKSDGTQETNASYWARGPFGTLEAGTGTGGSGSTNPGTGFTGASTPNSSGGFVYLRNRWYDPQTGRFLTQDPIGLAGGVNLYSYAGNNPVSFDDPFGLTECWLWSPKDSHDCVVARHEATLCQRGVLEACELSTRVGVVPGWAGGPAGGESAIGGSIARGWTKLKGLLMHVTRMDLRGAAAALKGLESGGQHLKEVREAVGGLRSLIARMEGVLGNPNATPAERVAAGKVIGAASRALDAAERALQAAKQ